jgi:hypothetical protein
MLSHLFLIYSHQTRAGRGDKPFVIFASKEGFSYSSRHRFIAEANQHKSHLAYILHILVAHSCCFSDARAKTSAVFPRA